jgi:FkbM family methyltransferase
MFKNQLKTVEGTVFWPIVAIIGSIKKTIQNRKFQLLWKDSDGHWYTRQKGMTLYSTEIVVDTYDEISNKVNKYFLQSYKPKSGDTVIDVGAGIGDDAIFFSRQVGPDGIVIAIEANPDTFKCMLKTVSSNNLKNVICLNLACTGSNTTVEISRDQGYLSNRIYSDRQFKDPHIVEGKTINQIIIEQKINEVSFLKLNIEGAEFDALSGAMSLIKSRTHFAVSCHDFKYLEGQGDFFKTYDKVADLFHQHNRQFYSIESNDRELPYYIFTK